MSRRGPASVGSEAPTILARPGPAATGAEASTLVVRGLADTSAPGRGAAQDDSAVAPFVSHGIANADLATQSPREATPPRPAGSAEEPFPGAERFGRYRLVAKLGVGGMGTVWKAWDMELQRFVALKQIRNEESGDGEMLQRFQREARLAAKLRHPRVVAVYDVGAIGGRPYLTMDFIEGRTLAAELDRTREAVRAGTQGFAERLRAEVALLADVSGAVAYAHGEGIIHRDLKPANVLLDAEDRPFVTDFGLAKEISADVRVSREVVKTQMTVAGQLLGTPSYMSPEQARGDNGTIGPSSDLWALGVMLYEVLTGLLPFEGVSAWEVLSSVTKEDPLPPRRHDRRVPPELEAVCLRALEKDPARRYAGVREFAEELRRWLRGEPVEARRPGLAYRLWRWAGRHRGLVAAAAATLLFAAWGAWTSWSAAQLRARVLDGLRTHSTRVLAVLFDARRKGALAAMDFLRPLMIASYEDAVREIGDSSPEPDFCMGRYGRAEGDIPTAIRHQERALAIDPEFAPSLYERAVLCAEEYHAELERVRTAAMRRQGNDLQDASAPVGEMPARAVPDDAALERSSPLLTELRARTMAMLGRLRRALRERPDWATRPDTLLRVGAAQIECAEGLLGAFTPGKLSEARAHLESALQQDPLMTEAVQVLAQVLMDLGEPEQAAAVCARALEQDRGWLHHGVVRAQALVLAAARLRDRGQDAQPLYSAALESLDRVIALDPRYVPGWSNRAATGHNFGGYLRSCGDDPRAVYARAIADCGKLLELEPDHFQAFLLRALVSGNWAADRTWRGEDAEELSRSALADLDRAIALDPESIDARFGRVRVLGNRALRRTDRGGDPEESLRDALAAADEAVQAAPLHLTAWLLRANVRLIHGQELHRRGRDPSAAFQSTVADTTRAAEIDRQDPTPWLLQAAARAGLGAYVGDRGGDPSELYGAAEAGYGRAIELAPGVSAAWAGRASVRSNWARLLHARGEDPTARYRSALADYQAALQRNPTDADTLCGRGLAHHNHGFHLASLGEDPSSLYADAIADFDRALAIHPKLGEAWVRRGGSRLNLGNFAQDRGADPREHFQAAESDYGKALDIDSTDVQARLGRGRARLSLAFDASARSGDAGESYRAAAEDCDRALAVAPADTPALLLRGKVNSNWAASLAERGQEDAGKFAAAEADFTRAVELDADLTEARQRRGILRLNWGLVRMQKGEDASDLLGAAIADFDHVLMREPDSVEAAKKRGHARLVSALGVQMRGGNPRELFAGAAADFADVLRRTPEDPEIRQWLPMARAALGEDPGAGAALWPAILARAAKEVQAGRATASLPLFEEALRLAGESAESDPRAHPLLASAHYHFARVLALVSVGREDPAGAAGPPPPAGEAARMRDQAFRQLEAAARLGAIDPQGLATDSDLAPLHSDPRWAKFLDRLK